MEESLRQDIFDANVLRIQFCEFLASIYLYEPTEEQIEHFAEISFVDDASPVAKGYKTIKRYLAHRDMATRQQIAVDYARVFLGAGTYDRITAPPYESVFTGKAQLMMQDARDKALSYYRSECLNLPRDNTTPEDHLGFELQFMAELIRRMNTALEQNDLARVCELADKQRSFFEYHQKNWVFSLCNAVDANCKTPFYHGIADLTRGYLASEDAFLSELADILGLDAEVSEVLPYWLQDDKETESGSSDRCDSRHEKTDDSCDVCANPRMPEGTVDDKG